MKSKERMCEFLLFLEEDGLLVPFIQSMYEVGFGNKERCCNFLIDKRSSGNYVQAGFYWGDQLVRTSLIDWPRINLKWKSKESSFPYHEAMKNIW